MGYGDIAAYNTSERVGYTVLFIVGAFIWGTLLAEINDIHVSSSARSQERMCKVQKTLEFLLQNGCPSQLRTEIIQWTRFHQDNQDDYGYQHEVILQLPRNLQKELVRHVYTRVVSRVPVFAYLESVDDNVPALDALQEIFVSDVFVLFEFKSYLPGDILVNFSDPADRLVIILSGKVLVEFEHPKFDRENMTLKADMYFGDMAILGDSKDWADSSSFNFLPQETETRDHTEIRVSAPYDYVVTIQLDAEKFQTRMEKAPVITKAAIQEFVAKWKDTTKQIMEELQQQKSEDQRFHSIFVGDKQKAKPWTKVSGFINDSSNDPKT